MQDRIALYPGRVTLTPVSGQENTYDMVRADEPTQVGTALSKANLLTDAVAAQFGLEDVAPNDIFEWLGKYNEHWWSLLHGQAYSYYEEKRETITNYVKVLSSNPADNPYIQYSKSITIDQSTGAVSLSSPTSLLFTNGAKTVAAVNEIISNAPCYIYIKGYTSAGPYYIPSGATFDGYVYSYDSTQNLTFSISRYSDDDTRVYLYLNVSEHIAAPASTVSSQTVSVPAGETTYEHSTDRNAYPDSGTVDGITYSYLGVPFEKFPTMPQVATGSYIGTGTYGSSNPNSLTFDFEPRAFSIAAGTNGCLLWTGGSVGLAVYGSAQLTFSVDGKTISWYSKNSNLAYQCNMLNVKYHYIALG